MYVDLLIALSLFILGFLYASVGHGGASGYLAIFSLSGIASFVYKPLVLLLNIIVSFFAFIQFKKAGYFKWKLIWPFLITSIPFAFLGAKFPIKGEIYNVLLGIALVFPILRLLQISPAEKQETKEINFVGALITGAFLGFAAGLLNIGGGIFLSPALILMGWANAKESAAASAFFILCNSIAGLISIKSQSFFVSEYAYLWFFAATLGGLAGAYFGSNLYKQKTVRYVLASVMSIACAKLLFF
ncbi:sulfite exporter TauE/SafE family protein [Pedobacter cryophilus]|uniref:Probable membrane transporter protein n=1 Tax=Pedobacter cryophilus TaxID=2571271 RepID=A0A4U1BX68_9SPHI|nr:sulfite exporter TauE/SafE family protein [Pedobacter cryophilus]TKB97596.1 sulfite exporter TauE/SafE family protein [Pedobacter cryophilus]